MRVKDEQKVGVESERRGGQGCCLYLTSFSKYAQEIIIIRICDSLEPLNCKCVHRTFGESKEIRNIRRRWDIIIGYWTFRKSELIVRLLWLGLFGPDQSPISRL